MVNHVGRFVRVWLTSLAVGGRRRGKNVTKLIKKDISFKGRSTARDDNVSHRDNAVVFSSSIGDRKGCFVWVTRWLQWYIANALASTNYLDIFRDKRNLFLDFLLDFLYLKRYLFQIFAFLFQRSCLYCYPLKLRKGGGERTANRRENIESICGIYQDHLF